MPSINLIGGNHLVFAADGNTLSEAVEAALRNKSVLEEFRLRGTAGSIFHALYLTLSRWLINLMVRTSHAKYGGEKLLCAGKPAQTLPQQRAGKINPIEDVTINIEHGVDFVGDPGMVWEIDGKQLVAKIGRPSEMEGGKAVKVYLDAGSLAIAAKMGNGNVSEGIRTALSEAALLRRDLGGVFSQRVSQGIFRG